MTEKGAAFLNKHFLQMAREDKSVQRATKREIDGYKEGQKIAPEKKIQAFLQRLEKLVDPQDPIQKERNIALLSHQFVEKVITAPEDVPEAYFANQVRATAEQLGIRKELTDEARDQEIDRIRANQQESLEKWVDYLAQNDGNYPMWFRYYVLRMVIKYEPFNKEQGTFKNRSKTTTKPFPELNAEVLALVYNDLLRKTATLGTQPKEEVASREWKRSQELWKTFKTTHPERAKLVEVGDFGTLYADSIRHLAEITKHQEGKERTTEGKWVKYDKGSGGTALSEAILGYDTGWCIVGRATAQSYVDQGDFYVYFSYDKEKHATIPRAAISVTHLGVTEVRGVAQDQNLEPEMLGEVSKMLHSDELREKGGDKYFKKMEDMRKLTAIEKKVKKGESLSQKDLLFLYEVNGGIEGFGYEDDPRIAELQEQCFTRVEVQEILPKLIRSKRQNIRERAANVVSENPELYAEELHLLAEDNNPWVREQVVQAMGHRPELFVDALTSIAKGQVMNNTMFTHMLALTGYDSVDVVLKNGNVRTKAIRTMRNRPELFVDVFTTIAKDKTYPEICRAAIQAMGHRPELFVDALTSIAKDYDYFNYGLGLDVIQAMGHRPELFVDALTTIAKDKTYREICCDAAQAILQNKIPNK